MGDFLGFQLGVTTGNNNKGPGMPAGYLADCLPAFFIGQFGDGTGVDNADVGDFSRSGFADTVLFEHFTNRGSLGEIEFATQCVVGRCFILKCMNIYHLLPVEMQI